MGSISQIALQYVDLDKNEINSRSKTGYKLTAGNGCADFVGFCMKELGVSYKESDVSGYGALAAGFPLYAVENGIGDGQIVSSPKAGDLVVFRNAGSYGSHVGIMVSSTQCVSGNGADMCRSRNVYSMASYYSSGIAAFVRLNELSSDPGGGVIPDDPDVPPVPKPGGHYEGVEEVVEITVPVMIEIGENECGRGVGSDQTGSQDEPKAPYQMDGNPDGSRLNERGEPLNMYTYERIMTYDQNDNPVGSSGEQKYSGSQTVMLGDQPAYGNGGEMDGGDE